MLDSWDNLIISLNHVTKLDMDYPVASLLLEELGKKSLETTTSSLRLQALVSEESNNQKKGYNQ